MQQFKTQSEILIAKIAKLELVLTLMMQCLRQLEPKNRLLDQAERILSQGN